MRAVFINHCHPDTPHVCATRLREFAKVMTARGHEIILLTETLPGQNADISVGKIGTSINEHDFDTPLCVAVKPSGHPLITKLRNKTLPWGFRQAVVVWYFLRHEGVFTDWRNGCQPYLQTIANEFKPDIIWASFGNTDCWNIARDLSQKAACPWVGDLKDLWRNFIPSLFRNFLNRNYHDNSGFTAFSKFHSGDVIKWIGREPTVVYSGFTETDEILDNKLDPEEIIVSLTGAIYDEFALKNLIEGVESWVMTLEKSRRKKVHFIYAGHDTAEVRRATTSLSNYCTIDIKGYLALDELHQLHQASIANLYIKADRTFHHKTIEILSASRPIICYPVETEEAIEIARSSGTSLFSCSSPDMVAEALRQSHKIEARTDLAGLHQFSWQNQAEILEEALSKAT